MQSVTVPRAGIPQIARGAGGGEENADLLADPAVKRGLRQVEDKT